MLEKRWGCIISPIVIVVCSFCFSLDGLLQECSRKLNFHLTQASICVLLRLQRFGDILSCPDKKVKLVQMRNIHFFPASSATPETFSAPCLHHHYGYPESSAAHCALHKQPIGAQAGTLSPALCRGGQGRLALTDILRAFLDIELFGTFLPPMIKHLFLDGCFQLLYLSLFDGVSGLLLFYSQGFKTKI